MATRSPSRRISLLFTIALVSLAVVPGRTQERRMAGPRDWSHGRVLAVAQSGAEDGNPAANWRALRKHEQIERMRTLRSEMASRRAIDALLNWLRLRVPPPSSSDTSVGLDWNLRTGGYGSVIGYPAKYSFDISASNCSDVTYFTVDQAGGSSTVNVIAITNPYAGCPGNAAGTTPTVKFGLRMTYGTATSAVPSLDGKTLYVLESRPSANGGVILHGINVDNITSNVGNYNFNSTNWSNAHQLAAPNGTASSEQKFQITFAGVTNNTSSPYLDYATNQLFFGDSAGRIHRVANVNSTSAVRDTTNFPVSCGTAALQSPVFVNGQIIVTSADGRLYRIDTTGGAPYTCIAARQGGGGTADGAGGGLSAPIVDVTNNKIIVSTNSDNDFGLAGVGVFNLMFTAGQAPVAVQLTGNGAPNIAPVPPAFDDDFWTTNDGSIYAAGNQYGGTGTFLLRIPYNGTTLGAVAGYAALTRSGAAGVAAMTPVTEFLTASSLANPDFVYVGGGGGNYRYMNRIRAGFNGTNNTPVAMDSSFAVTGGVSSGIVIDTRTTAMTGTTATANIYFGTVGIASTTQSLIIQLAQAF